MVTRRLAFRFVLKSTDKGRFSAMTIFAWLAVGVGLWAMGSLLSVMYGFESTLRDKVLTAFPHVMVKSKRGDPIPNFESWTAKFQGVKSAKRVVPYLEAEMVVQSDARTMGIIVWGETFNELQTLSPHMVGGLPTTTGKLPQLVVGSQLGDTLNVGPRDHVKIMSPTAKAGAMGALPQAETFEVSGLYTSGHYNFDRDYLFLLLEDAQTLTKKPGTITGWQIWLENQDDAARVAGELSKIIPADWEAQSWTDFNSALFHSLKLEQYTMYSILSMALLIAVMNVVITLMMNVNYKRKTIGILRALGASKKQIWRIFFWQGVFLGGIGICLGIVLTTITLYVLQLDFFQLPAFYYDRSIPFEIRPMSFVIIYGVTVTLIFLATIYPALLAAKQDPVTAIRE